MWCKHCHWFRNYEVIMASDLGPKVSNGKGIHFTVKDSSTQLKVYTWAVIRCSRCHNLIGGAKKHTGTLTINGLPESATIDIPENESDIEFINRISDKDYECEEEE